MSGENPSSDSSCGLGGAHVFPIERFSRHKVLPKSDIHSVIGFGKKKLKFSGWSGSLDFSPQAQPNRTETLNLKVTEPNRSEKGAFQIQHYHAHRTGDAVAVHRTH